MIATRRVLRPLLPFLMLALLAAVGACGRERGPMQRVTIPRGASMRTAVDSLSRHGIVRGALPFRLYAELRGHGRPIRAGTYLLPRGASWAEVVAALYGGKGLVHSVTIPEGFSIAQMIPLLSRTLRIPEESLEVAVRDTALLHEVDAPTATLEGYLFPDTYIFPDRATAHTVVAAMVRRFEQVWQPAWTARLDTLALSRHDVVTLASLVEKEAKLPEERPVIAAVYLNRLRSGMLLQADPTVQYARGQHTARVLYRDLKVDSPYNTYTHRGLPPGPIASPGRASLVASLYPAQVPYKFFVAFPDGHHEFRTDFAAHTKAKLLARRAWDALQPKPAAPPPRTRVRTTGRRGRSG